MKEDYYKTLGVSKGSTAAEIKKAYKKAAMQWHPDKHSAKSEAQQTAAQEKFKEIGDAYELLTDPVTKRLWDEGYDREEIKQRVEMMQQQQQHGGYPGGFHH